MEKRKALVALGFLGMALMYSLRFNLSIGIVAMVDDEAHANHSSDSDATSKTSNNTNNSSQSEEHGICPALIPVENSSSFISSSNPGEKRKQLSQGRNDEFAKFYWNEKEQGLLLGCFFWGYAITQFPAGILAQRYGGKWIVGLGLLGAGLLALILPCLAYVGGLGVVIFIRFLQGVSEGFMIPAFMVMLSKWTTASERASIASLIFSGMPFGTAMTMIISGHLISNFGWPAVFYVPGVLTILWFILWSLIVHSSPKPHFESLSPESDAKAKIEGEETHRFCNIPWKNILTSVPVWAILLSHFANTYGHNTLKSEGPKYLHSVLHLDIHQNAYVAATPYLCQWVFCIVITKLSDHLISKEWISISASRRLCNTIGQGGTAVAYGCLLLSECNRSLAIVAFILSGLFNGAVYGGFLINPIDISPNYAGVIEGMVNGISNLAGFGAPYIAGLILHSHPSMSGWRIVFLIPAITDFVGNLVFVLFSSTNVQPWDGKGETGMRKEITSPDNNNGTQTRKRSTEQ